MARRAGKLGAVGAVAGLGFGAIDGVMTYSYRRSQNPDESKGKSMTMAGATMAGWYLMPGVMWAHQGYQMSKGLAEAGTFNRNIQMHKKMQYSTQGGSWQYQDTEAAATMRQRGLDAMMQSRMHARSAIGGEARRLHRGAL